MVGMASLGDLGAGDPLDIDFGVEAGDFDMANTLCCTARGRGRTPAPALISAAAAPAPQPAPTSLATQTPRAALMPPPAPKQHTAPAPLAPTPRTVPGPEAPAAQSAPAAAMPSATAEHSQARSRTPRPTFVRAYRRRPPREPRESDEREHERESHDRHESSSVALVANTASAATAATGPGHCGICRRSASTGVDWAASAIVSGARVDVRDGCLRCVREVSILCPALPWQSAVQVASRSPPFRNCICVSGAVREALAVSLRSPPDVRMLLTQVAQGAAAAVEEIQGRSSLEDHLVEVSTQAEPRAPRAALTAAANQGTDQAQAEFPQRSRPARAPRRKRERVQTSLGRNSGAHPESTGADNHSLAWHQAKMPLSDVFLQGKNVKKLGNLINAGTASVDALNAIPSRQPEALALAKFVKIVAACDQLGSGELGHPEWEHVASVVDGARPQLPLVVPPANPTPRSL